jgi:hypothetical protein
MEKQLLKQVLETINSGDLIELTFAGERTILSGQYKVLTSKVGRGKCGSRIASLESLTDHSIVSIGTKENDTIVNITHNGTRHGFESMTEGNVAVSRNAAKALELKEKLKCLVGFGGRQISMVSKTEPELNGTFTLLSAELSKGRFGQMILHLTNNTTGKNVEFWSYRHSGLVESIDTID